LYDLIRDLKYALRRLAFTPGFTVATLITLALGIGANTAIFSIINSVLLKPLPFHEPDRLIGVWQTAPGGNIKDLNASVADYVTYREDSSTFADIAIRNISRGRIRVRSHPRSEARRSPSCRIPARRRT
jgi:putative ABC transport system permease protein